MFLQEVYKHNRWLFLAMALFIVAQLFINLKRGLVVSPFYHYGMYSEVINVETKYNVFEVQVNGKKLQAENFSPQQWDKIIVPLSFYTSIDKRSNTLYNTDVQRVLNKLHITSTASNFVQECNYNDFEKWYRLYL